MAVLVYPPDPSKLGSSLAKLNRVVDNCNPVMCLTDSKVDALRKASKLKILSKTKDMWPTVPFKCTEAAVSSSLSYNESHLLETDLAFLQYTSGSTGMSYKKRLCAPCIMCYV